MKKSVVLKFLVVAVALLATTLPIPAEANLESAFLDGCKRVLSDAAWIKRVNLSGTKVPVEWVTDAAVLPQIAEGMAAAFHEDPLMMWIAPDPTLRNKFIATLVRHAYMQGGVLTTKPLGTAAALWFEHAQTSADFLGMVFNGQALLTLKFPLAKTRGAMELDETITEVRTQILRAQKAIPGALYLYLIGVREEARGHGLATALIAPVLRYADENNKHVLLDIHNPVNRGLYEHFGFRVCHEQTVPEDAPTTRTMIRVPRVLAE